MNAQTKCRETDVERNSKLRRLNDVKKNLIYMIVKRQSYMKSSIRQRLNSSNIGNIYYSLSNFSNLLKHNNRI